MANPNPWKPPRTQIEVVYPAVEGVTAIFDAAEKEGINRIIMTSCSCTIRGSNYKFVYSEDDIGDPHSLNSVEKSKVFAEKTAMYLSDKNPKMKLTIFNPGFLLGPTLQRHSESSSCKWFKILMSNHSPKVYKLHIPLCDVRDAALAHVKALKKKETSGERYLLAQGSYWILDFAKILQKEYKHFGYILPLAEIGPGPLKLISFFDENARSVLPFYGKESYFSSEKARKDGLIYFRNVDETLVDMAESFIEKKFIEDLTKPPPEELNELMEVDENDIDSEEVGQGDIDQWGVELGQVGGGGSDDSPGMQMKGSEKTEEKTEYKKAGGRGEYGKVDHNDSVVRPLDPGDLDVGFGGESGRSRKAEMRGKGSGGGEFGFGGGGGKVMSFEMEVNADVRGK